MSRVLAIYREAERRLGRAPGSLAGFSLERIFASEPTMADQPKKVAPPPLTTPTRAPLQGTIELTRADEISPDAARQTIATLAGIVAQEQHVSFDDALLIVQRDPTHAPLVDALQPGRNAYMRKETRDALEAGAELDNLALERARSEKLTYKDALRQVSDEHPELEDARDQPWRRY